MTGLQSTKIVQVMIIICQNANCVDVESFRNPVVNKKENMLLFDLV